MNGTILYAYRKIAFEFSYGGKSSRDNGGDPMINPDKWAENIDCDLRRQDEDESAQGQVFLQKRTLLDSQAPLLWKQLTTSLSEFAMAFNKRRSNTLTIEDEGEMFHVRRSAQAGAARLSATFYHLEHKIALVIEPGDWFRGYTAKVVAGSGEGTVCLVLEHSETGSKTRQEIDEIASSALEELLKGRH